ncbi:hypothetical protein QQS21_010001 [Conoideocrella luteorostrata]|uniref:Uncharacterized protein n=1 Tax=Conoideocrella luteorostrata TaxID=1105319 RepID=A0AAJ0CKD0_9HYPO|nr:hypothetical protein QQS21_010001 [Conoideocrella luteorostrata]
MSFLRRVRPKARDLGDPHSWELPSSYSAAKPTQAQPHIPNPTVFESAFIPRELQPDGLLATWHYPNVSHSAVHLALLECFRNLRLSATALDLAISSASSGTGEVHEECQNWNVLKKLAVTRFATWWSNIDRVLVHAKTYGHHAGDGATVQLQENYLPPLDVLLVWYTFMLDPISYRANCRDRESEIPELQKLCFPWPAILKAINLDTMQYSVNDSAKRLFKTLTGKPSDILTYLKESPAYVENEDGRMLSGLVAQLQQQQAFVEEAHALLWIRSPALSGSLTRAIEKYFKPEMQAVIRGNKLTHIPFDLALIRRTHQLFPHQQEIFLHNIGEPKDKSELKQSANEEPKFAALPDYISSLNGDCFCWTCERIRDEVPGFTCRDVVSNDSRRENQISTLSPALVDQIIDDLGFYETVEKARRSGDPLPTRPPTIAEKEAAQAARVKQDQAGYLPGPHEYIKVLPDGTRVIRKQKNSMPWSGFAWTLGGAFE